MGNNSRLAMLLALFSVLSADYGAAGGGIIIPFVIKKALDVFFV